jgi:hypothetical protein
MLTLPYPSYVALWNLVLGAATPLAASNRRDGQGGFPKGGVTPLWLGYRMTFRLPDTTFSGTLEEVLKGVTPLSNAQVACNL